jgi:hypothetical protein
MELGSTLLVAQVPPPPIHGNGRCEPTPSRAKRAQAVASVSLIHGEVDRGRDSHGRPREGRPIDVSRPRAVGRDCVDSRQGLAARDSRHQDHHHGTPEGAVAAIKNSPGSCSQPRRTPRHNNNPTARHHPEGRPRIQKWSSLLFRCFAFYSGPPYKL